MTKLRISTAGESHGPGEVCIVEGIPAGLTISAEGINKDLQRRQLGYGRGGRMGIERDQCRFMGGVRLGRTLGSPICIVVENVDYANWADRMTPDTPVAGQSTVESKVTLPRPGHADLGGLCKYGHTDIRDVLERASARETVARVAAGAICKELLRTVGVTVQACVVRIGESALPPREDLARPDAVDWQAVEASPVGCEDPIVSQVMCASIDTARDAGESLGGVLEVWCWGTVPGVGGYSSIGERLDGRLVGSLVSIPAIKGAEIGPAFDNASRCGSEVHDSLFALGRGRKRWISRRTNRAGGIEGGMTTGMPIVVRAAMKPIPTLTSALPSVDTTTMESARAHVERSDVTAVPAARVVGEAMVAYVLADAYLEKFGGDSADDFVRAVRLYEEGLQERGLWHRS